MDRFDCFIEEAHYEKPQVTKEKPDDYKPDNYKDWLFRLKFSVEYENPTITQPAKQTWGLFMNRAELYLFLSNMVSFYDNQYGVCFQPTPITFSGEGRKLYMEKVGELSENLKCSKDDNLYTFSSVSDGYVQQIPFISNPDQFLVVLYGCLISIQETLCEVCPTLFKNFDPCKIKEILPQEKSDFCAINNMRELKEYFDNMMVYIDGLSCHSDDEEEETNEDNGSENNSADLRVESRVIRSKDDPNIISVYYTDKVDDIPIELSMIIMELIHAKQNHIREEVKNVINTYKNRPKCTEDQSTLNTLEQLYVPEELRIYTSEDVDCSEE